MTSDIPVPEDGRQRAYSFFIATNAAHKKIVITRKITRNKQYRFTQTQWNKIKCAHRTCCEQEKQQNI